MKNRRIKNQKELKKSQDLGVVRRRIEDIHDRMIWNKLWELSSER